jgi:hypothetical protein
MRFQDVPKLKERGLEPTGKRTDPSEQVEISSSSQQNQGATLVRIVYVSEREPQVFSSASALHCIPRHTTHIRAGQYPVEGISPRPPVSL